MSKPYRQPRKPTQYQYEFSQDWGKIWGGIFTLALLGGFLLWPAVFFHGEREDTWTGQEHWAWNTGSTVACCIWWGFLLVVTISVLVSRGKPLHEGPQDTFFPEG